MSKKLGKRLGNVDQAAKLGMFPDRVFERSQGCWNCRHFDVDKAKDLWWQKARASLLAKGVQISLTSPHGENDPRVMNIRRMVPDFDGGLERGIWGVCKAGKGGGDFIASTYLCPSWTGAPGASVARGGEAPDLLPEEIAERLGDEDKKGN